MEWADGTGKMREMAWWIGVYLAFMSDSMMLHEWSQEKNKHRFLCPKDKNLGDLICKEKESACNNLEHTQHVFIPGGRHCGNEGMVGELSCHLCPSSPDLFVPKENWSRESKETKGLSFTGCHLPMPSRIYTSRSSVLHR